MERLVDGESALYRQEYLVDIAYEPEDPRERIFRLSEALGRPLRYAQPLQQGLCQSDVRLEVSGLYLRQLGRAAQPPAKGLLGDFHRHRMAGNVECAPLFELCFLTGLCHHHLGNPDRADVFLKAVFYSAQAVDSCYAAVCREISEFTIGQIFRNLSVDGKAAIRPSQIQLLLGQRRTAFRSSREGMTSTATIA